MFRATIFSRIELRLALGLLTFALMSEAGQAEVPAHLPRYDLNIQLDTDQHTAVVRQRIVWTNGCSRPAADLNRAANTRTSVYYPIIKNCPTSARSVREGLSLLHR
jgi:hypothetical protein